MLIAGPVLQCWVFLSLFRVAWLSRFRSLASLPWARSHSFLIFSVGRFFRSRQWTPSPAWISSSLRLGSACSVFHCSDFSSPRRQERFRHSFSPWPFSRSTGAARSERSFFFCSVHQQPDHRSWISCWTLFCYHRPQCRSRVWIRFWSEGTVAGLARVALCSASPPPPVLLGFDVVCQSCFSIVWEWLQVEDGRSWVIGSKDLSFFNVCCTLVICSRSRTSSVRWNIREVLSCPLVWFWLSLVLLVALLASCCVFIVFYLA
jgi:hypothetical protein